jgi:gas vesicle protein
MYGHLIIFGIGLVVGAFVALLVAAKNTWLAGIVKEWAEKTLDKAKKKAQELKG